MSSTKKKGWMGERKIKISHIVNPVAFSKNNASYLNIAQPITFKSMVTAKNMAKKENVLVSLFSAQVGEEVERGARWEGVSVRRNRNARDRGGHLQVRDQIDHPTTIEQQHVA